ncbi:hypothetical protein Avbf_16252, partial [Armadillidium vulgare]
IIYFRFFAAFILLFVLIASIGAHKVNYGKPVKYKLNHFKLLNIYNNQLSRLSTFYNCSKESSFNVLRLTLQQLQHTNMGRIVSGMRQYDRTLFLGSVYGYGLILADDCAGCSSFLGERLTEE